MATTRPAQPPAPAPMARRIELAPESEQPLVETLTRRELEVLGQLARGASIDEIAESLTISVLTARNHAANIARKLGAHNRLETVLLAMRHGLVQDPPAGREARRKVPRVWCGRTMNRPAARAR